MGCVSSIILGGYRRRGAASVILAFLSVFYTIRYYKESDAQKERATVQQFLMVELELDSKDNNLRTEFGLGYRTEDKDKQPK